MSLQSSNTEEFALKKTSFLGTLDLIFPLLIKIAFTLFFIFSFILLFRSIDKTPKFQSPDRYFKDALHCPQNANCISGKLFCKDGFVRVGNRCEKSMVEIEKERQLAYKISDYIANNITETCEGRIFSIFELEDIFFNDNKYFPGAIRCIDDNVNGFINVNNITKDSQGNYYSRTPNLPLKCKIQKRIEERKGTLYLIIFVIVLTIISVCIILYQNSINDKVRYYSNSIIRKMNETHRFSSKYHDVSNFRPIQTDPMMKYWDRIVKNIERNPNVCTIQTTHGKQWKLIKK